MLSGIWWTLRRLWPQRVQETTWVAFLSAIYPGFQSIHLRDLQPWLDHLGGFLPLAGTDASKRCAANAGSGR